MRPLYGFLIVRFSFFDTVTLKDKTFLMQNQWRAANGQWPEISQTEISLFCQKILEGFLITIQ